MAVNQIYKYVWLVDTIYRVGKISFEEINKRWLENDMSEGVDISKRTFHKWRIAVEEIFGLVIDNENKGEYRYYIANPQVIATNALSQWLINTTSVSSLLMSYKEINDKILLEEIPISSPYLEVILSAIKARRVVKITYQSFRKTKAETFEVGPYGVKLFRQRWYMIGESLYYGKVMIYAFDRISCIDLTEKHFDEPEGFSLISFFQNSYGVIAHDGTPLECVRLRVYGRQVDYFRTLPLHRTQREVTVNADDSVFEYHLCPTFDFKKDILSYGQNVEVLSPAWLRNQILQEISKMVECYK